MPCAANHLWPPAAAASACLLACVQQEGAGAAESNGAEAALAADVSAISASSKLAFVRQPAPFCTNCCTPLDPLRPGAPCGSCGHSPGDDALLLSRGISSQAEYEQHCPPWLLQGGQRARQQATGAAGLATLRQEAALALRRGQALLRDAGVVALPRTLLAWEDESTEAEPPMLLHRGLLPPNHERPERLRAVMARLRDAGLLGACTRRCGGACGVVLCLHARLCVRGYP